MTEAIFILMTSFRLSPMDPTTYDDPDFIPRNRLTMVAEAPEFISEGNNSCSVKTEGLGDDRTGWRITMFNHSAFDEMFLVDMNTKSIDLNTPRRIRMVYPQESYLQIKDQKPSHEFNNVVFCNRIAFDTQGAKRLSETSTESVYLWHPTKEDGTKAEFSTPWMKHAIGVSVPPSGRMEFTLEMFRAEDLNMDGKVNAADLSVLLSLWGTPKGDINGDGRTDGTDQGILLGAFDKAPEDTQTGAEP